VQQTCNSVQHRGALPQPSRLRTVLCQPFSSAFRSHGCTDGSATQTTLRLPRVCYKSLYFLKPSMPRPAASPPPRRAVGAFGPSAAELQSRGGVPSIGVHHLGSAPYYPRTSVRGSGNLSEGTRRASRPAARQPATSIVGAAVGLPAQRSRVRSAGLRPPLIAACCGVPTLPHTGTMGAGDSWWRLTPIAREKGTQDRQCKKNRKG